MTVEELKARVDAGKGPVVLDVREARELRIASFPFDVIHIPLGLLPHRLAELPRDAEIVCVCRSGARCGSAARFLAENGFDAVNLEGGILAWSQRIDPSIRQY